MENHKNKANKSRQRFGSLLEEEYRENYEFQHRHDSSSRNNTDRVVRREKLSVFQDGIPAEYEDERKQAFLEKNYKRRDYDQDRDRDQTKKREKFPYGSKRERILDYIQRDQATFGYEGSRRENERNTRDRTDQPNPGYQPRNDTESFWNRPERNGHGNSQIEDEINRIPLWHQRSYHAEDKFDRFQGTHLRLNPLEHRYNKNTRDEFEYSPDLRYLGRYQEPPRDFNTANYNLNRRSMESSNVARMAFDRYQEDNSRRNSPPQRKSGSTSASESREARNVDWPSKFVFNPDAPVFIPRNRQRKE